MSSSIEDRAATVSSPRLRLLARVIFGLTILGIAAGIWFSIIDAGKAETDLAFLLSFCLFPIIGYILAIRRPDNAISWLMLGIGAAFGLDAFVGSYASYAIHGGVGGYHAGAIALAFDQPMWVPIVGLPATFLILLFPDGHLPSPRWRWFAWVLGISMVITFLAILFGPGRFEESAFPNVVNPLGSEALRPVLAVATGSIIMLPIGVIGSLVSLVQRFRRSTGIERLQLRWLVTAAGTVAILYASALILSFNSAWGTEATPGWLGVIQTLAIVSFGLIPIAIGISVLRYHLFDIDLVINRALLLAAMVVFITLVYVAIVVGVGALVGSQANPRPFRGGRRGRRPRVPAGAEACSAFRRPPRLRKASDALRGALAVLRSARERVRERGAAAEDGPGAGRGHGRIPRRRLGPRRRRAPSGGRVAIRRRSARTPRGLGEHRRDPLLVFDA
jgi:hypothetical protein